MPSVLPKPSAAAAAITGKKVTVYSGGQGPATDAKSIIYMGEADNWTRVEKYAVLIHECCHIMYPAKYPQGNATRLANLIDDCRIERQCTETRKHYINALTVLAVEVIANNKYGADKDIWSEEGFDPATFALLYFRTYLPRKVRKAAYKTVMAYAKRNGLTNDSTWEDRFKALVNESLRITRLKKVSIETLTNWVHQYIDVFPDAEVNAEDRTSGMSDDNEGSTGKSKAQDQEGDGDGDQDDAETEEDAEANKGKSADADKDDSSDDSCDASNESDEGEDAEESEGNASGEDSDNETKSENQSKGKGKGEEDAEHGIDEAQESHDDSLADAIDELIKACGEVAQVAVDEVSNDLGSEEAQSEDTNEGGEGDDDDASDNQSGKGIGKNAADIKTAKGGRAMVNRTFVTRFKMMVRKLTCVAQDMKLRNRRSGKLDRMVCMRAERIGTLPRKPFLSHEEEFDHIPVAVAVATDYSGSTQGINHKLRTFAHNAMYALQSAHCEVAEVVWNHGYKVTKTLEETVSPTRMQTHVSDGGTSLMAAVQGCVKGLQDARATRKVAFIFTDGCLSESEVIPAAKHLQKHGFEGALIVSLDSAVKRHGIIDTALCRDITKLTGVFERWTTKQVSKATVEAVQ